MNIVQQKIYLKIAEIALLLILTLLPFSYKTVNTQQIVFFSILLVICVFMHISKKIKPANHKVGRVFFVLLFMLIFDRTEKVNLIEQIPLSTLFLVIGMLVLLVKIIVEGKVKVIDYPFTKYFFYACVFLLTLTVLFYPFFFHHYQMQTDSNIHLLSNIVKYAILFILVTNCLPNEKTFKIMNLGFIFNLSVTLILSILL
jgi:hypothetical protein